ncbi:hypothetical protein FKW77_004167 [Venturia effusa]|uniref:BTB domain-containing protein n=1 Tax=Venturia effusa TaxID=50376 RepID=A0A517KW60_9PEZI|nr:hypothetical protein FKW77_004167 [Venturia effusa]
MTSEDPRISWARSFHASLFSALRSGEFSDLTIICGNETHKVHKVVMCALSPWFVKACGGGFKESQSGEIKLEDDDPMAVKAMIDAIYRADYSHGDNNVPSASLRFHAMVSVYALGDKFDIFLLRKLAKENFELGCKAIPEAQHLTSAIEEVYSSTLSSNRGLRDIAIRTAIRDSRVLWDDLDFNNMVERVGEFGRDMAKALCIGEKRKLRYSCEHCVNRFNSERLNGLNQVWCPSCSNQCDAILS